MNEQRLETLSALMDGELDSTQQDAFADLARDESLRRVWGRYHLIAACLHREMPRYLDRKLAERLSVVLRNEPTVLAPQPSVARAMIRPLAGFAIAASVAALAIYGIQQSRSPDTSIPAAPVASIGAPSTVPEGRVEVAAGSTIEIPARPQLASGHMSARLNRYLVNYNEYRHSAAVQGMFPYVRIVAHDDER